MNNKIIIEVCANSVESAIAAQKGGAARVELCDNMYEGGTTPGPGTIILARENLTINMFVLIRPRGGDFCYSEDEYEIMKKDILFCKECGVNGVVTGILKPDGSIDIERTKELVGLAKPIQITFHRAFDMCRDPFEAMQDIISTGAVRVLTSGQKQTAFEGRHLIAELIQKAGDKIIIMPGSGINTENIQEIINTTGANEYHLSGRTVRHSKMEYRNPEVSMGGLPGIPEYEIPVTNAEVIRSVYNKIKNIK